MDYIYYLNGKIKSHPAVLNTNFKCFNCNKKFYIENIENYKFQKKCPYCNELITITLFQNNKG
ncbi:hypothetical protein CDJ58_03730 [Campylobacter lari]|nr:hypothetical protein [Campylobacter lari]EAK5748509.1 hypothetical protein [Campylobacter lari]EAK9878166.1 hypothetical protein [Campylobacter lari]